MMNRIKEPLLNTHQHFIIEISLILQKIQKKIIISLFISDNLKVKELKEFISKDFDFPINSMSFFSPLKGNLEDSYEFKFEPDKIVNLNLILNDFKESYGDLNKDIFWKKQDIQKNNNENKIFGKNEINNSIPRNNDFFSFNNEIKKIYNFNDNKNEPNIFKGLNIPNFKLNSLNNAQNEIITKNGCEKKINQVKNDNYNFILEKTNEKQKDKIFPLLNRKRFSTTFKTTKLNKDNQETKPKQNINSNKKNIKVINFNINKNINISKVNELKNDKIS